jgi:integrase
VAAPGRVLAQTGLRISEALALRWSEVDFGRRRVLVRRRLRNGSFGPPKSRYGRRDVPVSTAMGRRLWAARAGRKAGDGDPVFCAGSGGYLDAANVFGRVFKPAARRAGVPWAGFHSLRHTCATVLFRRGLNAKQVQVWLGHHSPAFTLAVYVHLLSDDLPDADLFEAVEEPGGVEVEAEPLARRSRKSAASTSARGLPWSWAGPTRPADAGQTPMDRRSHATWSRCLT